MAKSKSISFEINGVEGLLSQLDSIVNSVENTTPYVLEQVTLKIRELAIILAPANDGQLRNSIKRDVYMQGSEYIGKTYIDINDVPYAMYVYYGTGEYAKIPNKNKKSWIVHESQFTKDISKYSFTELGNGYYVVKGQEAKPFLEWAMANSKLANIDIVKDEVKLAIERCLWCMN